MLKESLMKSGAQSNEEILLANFTKTGENTWRVFSRAFMKSAFYEM